jgi:hypothetical protein
LDQTSAYSFANGLKHFGGGDADMLGADGLAFFGRGGDERPAGEVVGLA